MKNKCKKSNETTSENKKAMSVAKTQATSYENEINTDPFGSYTGVPTADPFEEPIQDADDL